MDARTDGSSFDLADKKRALLEALLAEEGLHRVPRQVIPRRTGDGHPPLSFAQQRLWFLDQLVPGNPFYCESSAVRWAFPLDVGVFERSVNEVVQRHESLRTTFHLEDGQPVQVVAPALTVPLPIVDLRHLPPREREAEAQRLATEEAQRSFDLGRGPLVRTTLLRLDEADYVFLFTLHHIVCDGWSMTVFAQELGTLYTVFAQGEPSPLPPLPIQYADFAVWQRDWLQGDVLARQLDYWKQQLADVSPLQLPTDHPRPPVQSFAGAQHPVRLPLALSRQLQALSQREGATLFMTLLAAFQVLLHRYTGQTDIVVGSPIANRTRAEIEGLIGFFVNTLVVRTDFSGNPSFRDVLRRVREVALGAYAHQDLPFEKLVEELHPERDLGRNPVFQVTFQLFAAPVAERAPTEQDLAEFNVQGRTAKFDLRFDIWETAEGLSGQFEYCTDLFDASTIARLARHYRSVIEGIVADPDRPVGLLPLLTPDEERQALANDTAADVSYDRSIPELFDAQAARTPDAVAVACGADVLTYRELSQRAGRLARVLRNRGVGPDVLVAVCVERSADMIVGLLGVLQAGGAYVPLDPAYPAERLAFMLDDMAAAVILTEPHLVARLPAKTTNILMLDAISEDGAPDGGPQPAIRPDNLAYVIYTSGSTGRPKGVATTHAGLLNLALWHQRCYDITPADRATQIASPAFDASVWEIWPYLLAGASVHIPDDETRSDPPRLWQWLAREQITICFLPTPLAEAALELPLPPALSLTRLLTGGDTLHQVPRADLPFTLFNHYGPTENSVVTTSAPVVDGADAKRPPPIGRPIANTQTYVLDRHLQPVPIGVHGELYIGGDGLARGYLHRPALTAASFVPHPFSTTPGARLYRSGDLVRLGSDGNLEFLGRVDRQVKLRGYRIELGEIESVLHQHPAVQEAVAVLREDRPGEQRLVAYMTARGHDSSTPDGAHAAEQVAHWQMLYDETYAQPASQPDPTFNIVGWNSSYSGQPIPAEEMAEWVSATVERLRAFRPDRVLEIGCGTGLLLFRLAPECSTYVGTDLSAPALAYVRAQIDQADRPLSHVRLLERKADESPGLAERSVDTVVLNSVIQYFPSGEYLLGVIEKTLPLVAPGGRIFIGDVRSLPLLEAFHTSVVLARSPAALPAAKLRQRVRRRIVQEQELVLDPAFFLALMRALPRITHVAVEPKRGRHHNELTKFRYDVTLFVDATLPSPGDHRWIDWQEAGLTIAALEEILQRTAPPVLGLWRVPNARTAIDLRGVEVLSREADSTTTAELQHATYDGPDSSIDPEDLWRLSETLPFTIDLRWSGAGADGCFDVLFRRREAASADQRIPFVANALPEPETLSAYANDPQRGAADVMRVADVRRFLEARLPEHMVPSTVVVVDALPRTPHGKLDRAALPPPDAADRDLDGAYVPPRTVTEEMLAELWAQLLGLDRVGVHDNFFTELGGHSLLATQLIARARDLFDLDLPLGIVFEAPTVAALATAIDAMTAGSAKTAVPAIPKLARDERRVDLSALDASERAGARPTGATPGLRGEPAS